MTERITDEWLNDAITIAEKATGNPGVAGDWPFGLRALKDLRDARARNKKLEDRVRELELERDTAEVWREAWQEKFKGLLIDSNALRDAVRGFEDFTTLPYRTDGVDKCVAEWWHKVKALTEDTERPQNTETYPCDKCGALRTKSEGGTTFTVCDKCWDNTETSTRSNDVVTASTDEEPKEPALDCPLCKDTRRITTDGNISWCPDCDGKEPKE